MPARNRSRLKNRPRLNQAPERSLRTLAQPSEAFHPPGIPLATAELTAAPGHDRRDIWDNPATCPVGGRPRESGLTVELEGLLAASLRNSATRQIRRVPGHIG